MNPPEQKDEEKPRHQGLWTWKNFRDVSLGLLMLVIAGRMIFATTTIDLSGFNFTDLLSLILAIAAIGLSAAFYFKADESARGFYNNTYQFTKEVSEILGRIEAGFGQQLAHINEGYAGLNRKIDSMPYNPELLREQEEAKKAEIAAQEATRDEIIEDLMRRAEMDDEEKQALSSKLEMLQREADQSKAQLSQLSTQENADIIDQIIEARRNLAIYVASRLSVFKHLGDEHIQERVRDLIDSGEMPKIYIRQLKESHMLVDRKLTSRGLHFIRSVINS